MINLPSKKVGDPSTCLGKVVVDIYGLKCSETLSFEKKSLSKLCSGAKKLFNSLKGGVSILSTCESFKLTIAAGSTGNIKVEASMKKYQFAQPNNAEWQASGSFYDNPECLLQLIEAENDINS